MTNFINPEKLTKDLGGKWYRSYGVAPCPMCQPQRRRDQNALGITVKDGTLLMNCKKDHCDFRDILSAAGVSGGRVAVDQMAAEAAEVERRAHAEKRLENARSLWEHGNPIQGTKGEAYLRARGITCSLPDTLRWLPDANHRPTGRYMSAMVADVSSGGVHRTFFTKQGERLKSSAKMMLGPCQGGVVRLSENLGSIVVCEGIETGLSLMSGLLAGSHTVWAALSTSGVRGVDLPKRSGSLIVAPDGDSPGHEAAIALATRAYALGWQVSLMPAPDGLDWNDVLQSGVVA